MIELIIKSVLIMGAICVMLLTIDSIRTPKSLRMLKEKCEKLQKELKGQDKLP